MSKIIKEINLLKNLIYGHYRNNFPHDRENVNFYASWLMNDLILFFNNFDALMYVKNESYLEILQRAGIEEQDTDVYFEAVSTRILNVMSLEELRLFVGYFVIGVLKY